MRFIITQVFIAFFLTALQGNIYAGVIVVDGTYQGDNIYVQNPYNSSGNDFCVTKAFLNDVAIENITTSAFEIDLSNFSKGDYINIRLVHKDYCKPRILNPEVLRSKSTFELVNIKVDDTNLQWTTNNETSHEPFIIEHFRNNKWVPSGKVIGKGPEGYNNYSYEVTHHSGENRYRIKQHDEGNKFRYIHPVEYYSNRSPISFYPKRVTTDLFLSESTTYEIFDSFGSIVAKGNGQNVDVEDLDPGIYYLNIDNRTEKFLKK